MSDDYSLSDLAGDESAVTGSGNDGGGEWVEKLINRLDDRGYLDAIIARQFDIDDMGGPESIPDGGAPSSGSASGQEIDADTIANFGKLVIDNVGDVPISTVVKFAEGNPDQVNGLIQSALGGGEGPDETEG